MVAHLRQRADVKQALTAGPEVFNAKLPSTSSVVFGNSKRWIVKAAA